MRGILDLKTMISNLGDILKEQAPSLRNGVLSLKTVGKSVVYEGVQVPYYTEVMKSLVLTADVPVGALLGNTLKGLIGPNGSLGDLIGKDDKEGGKDGGGLLSSLFGSGGDGGGEGGQAVKDAIDEFKKKKGGDDGGDSSGEKAEGKLSELLNRSLDDVFSPEKLRKRDSNGKDWVDELIEGGPLRDRLVRTLERFA